MIAGNDKQETRSRSNNLTRRAVALEALLLAPVTGLAIRLPKRLFDN